MIEVDDVLGEGFDADEIPDWPGRIYASESADGVTFNEGFPYAPVKVIEVRFMENLYAREGDFIVHEARRVDTSNPDDIYGEWEMFKAYDD
jgi:hypothetical protein